MSRDVTDIHGERVDFASSEEVVSFFVGLFLRKKERDLAFLEDALPKSQKALFLPKQTYKK